MKTETARHVTVHPIFQKHKPILLSCSSVYELLAVKDEISDCLFELQFYSRVNTVKGMLSQSVYLTKLFQGMLTPLSS